VREDRDTTDGRKRERERGEKSHLIDILCCKKNFLGGLICQVYIL